MVVTQWQSIILEAPDSNPVSRNYYWTIECFDFERHEWFVLQVRTIHSFSWYFFVGIPYNWSFYHTGPIEGKRVVYCCFVNVWSMAMASPFNKFSSFNSCRLATWLLKYKNILSETFYFNFILKINVSVARNENCSL